MRATQETVELWRERLETWKGSGKNIAKWCKDNGVPYVRFFYWRDRLSEERSPIDSSKPLPQFIELKESPQSLSVDSGVSLSFQETHIHLSKDFDRDTLLRCLQTLKAF